MPPKNRNLDQLETRSKDASPIFPRIPQGARFLVDVVSKEVYMERFVQLLLRDHLKDTDCGLVQGIDILAIFLHGLRLYGILVVSPLQP